jgi:virginiamycin B lyase
MGKANKIGRMTTDGQVLEFSIPTPNSSGNLTRSMALGADGAVWFVESEVSQIGRIGTDGRITEFPLSANSKPTAITTGPDGALWITEFADNRIARLTRDGSVIEYPIPTPNSSPKGITVGADGALWFVEQDAKAIGRITAGGQVTEYAVPGVDHLWGGITTGPDGALWFSEGDQTDVGRITSDGKITHFTLGVSPDVGMTVGPDKAIWFTDGGMYVGRVSTDGHLTGYQPPTARSAPSGIVAAPDGALWFTENSANRIGRLVPATAVGECRTPAADLTVPDGSQVQPGDVLSKVWRFTNCGTTTWDHYQAIRIQGDFGPQSVELPPIAPGQTLNLTMPVQAPDSPGCYEVDYALQGPRGQFGWGFGLIIDVIDPSVTRLTPGELEGTLVQASDLGDGWSSSTKSAQVKCGDKPAPSESASAGFVGPAGIAGMDLIQLRSVDDADNSVAQLPKGIPDTVTTEPVDGLGDSAANTWSTDTVVGYQFRVGLVAVQIAVWQLGATHDETVALARQLADLQEQRLRAALDGGARS